MRVTKSQRRGSVKMVVVVVVGGGMVLGCWSLFVYLKKKWRFKSENHPNLRGFDRDFKVNMHNFRLDG